MTVRKIRALASGVLLLVSAEACLAEDRRNETFDATWDTLGQNAEKELAALPKDGRRAYQKALIACSLYADEYSNDKYGAECRRATTFFSVEFASASSSISSLLKLARSLTAVYESNIKMEYQQGRRPDLTAGNPATIYIDFLKKAYRDTR